MLICRTIVFLLVACAAVSLATTGTGTLCPSELPDAIVALLNQSQNAGSAWGVLVETLDNSTGDYQTLFALNNDRFFLPASNK